MYTTIYTRQIKRRGTTQAVTIGCAYTTKSLSTLHENIRLNYPDAQTWKGLKRCITDLIPGMNLGTLPLVSGGERIA